MMLWLQNCLSNSSLYYPTNTHKCSSATDLLDNELRNIQKIDSLYIKPTNHLYLNIMEFNEICYVTRIE